MAPPLLANTNDKGELIKQTYGPWMFGAMRLLAKLKGLRGTAFDPFGRTEERRTERELIGRYQADVERLIAELTPERHALALRVAGWPDAVRGYGHVKERHLAQAMAQRSESWAQWDAQVAAPDQSPRAA